MDAVRYEANDENGKPLYNVDLITNDAGHQAYVFSNHPDKAQDAPDIWAVAPEKGDAIVDYELSKDAKFRPESLSVYVERPERGADGESRFSEWEATTKQFENVSTTRGVYDAKVSEWSWEDGNRMDKSELEDRLQTSIETVPFQAHEQKQNEDWKTFSFATREDQADPGRRETYQQELQQQPQEATTVEEREHDQGIGR